LTDICARYSSRIFH